MLITLCRVVLTTLGLIPFVDADLPVHCLRHQIVGEWEFTLGPLGTKRSGCGHQTPDSPEHQPPMTYLTSLGQTTRAKFTLADPDTATNEHGKVGTWTMIYDEGFEVAVANSTFFAFSKFDWVQTPKGRSNVSRCGATQIGWYRDRASSMWGCYAGQKVSSGKESLHDRSRPNTDNSEPSQDLPPPNRTSFTSVHRALVEGSAGFDLPMTRQWIHRVASSLNLLQLGWVASAYENHQFFNQKSPRELNRAAGIRRTKSTNRLKVLPGPPSSFLVVKTRLRHAVGVQSGMDWRNKDGKNWLTPVVNQGDCGSCYTISTMHMLTARNRIRENDTHAPSFSMSFPLYCSEYNQGCDGGYGFLQTKWSEDVGLVPESCAPFSDGGGSCQIAPSCALGTKRYRATGHHYVGGYYGGSDEKSMRSELVQSGPLVVSFEPTEDFMYYKGGIYRSGARKLHAEWEQVDHAVLLVGYGVEKAEPFWSVQNSWGDDWGEDGYFRMARGIDESGIEGIAVAAHVVEETSNQVLDDFIASAPKSD